MSQPEVRTPRAKPFLKWAGGKTQLLAQFAEHFPSALKDGKITRYVEPFLGSGAVFLHIVQTYPIEAAYLSDVNSDLILAWRVIQDDPLALIESLSDLHTRYHSRAVDDRESFFYEIRSRYNEQRRQINHLVFADEWATRAAYMIFLNKTCYNGLYRLNSKGAFNVPFGRYKNPAILDEQNILRVSALLKKTELHPGPFTDCAQVVDDQTFVYCDPPYRPLTATASFTAYAKNKFTDEDQGKLAHFCAQLDTDSRARLMLSNSDPANTNPNDDFFDKLYADFNIYRVYANRMINANAARRGKITELVITNYLC